ncbi:MAG: hypothetical protein ACI4EQ_00610 [Lachnospiraceae bacterium]
MKKAAKWLTTILLLCILFFSPAASGNALALSEEEAEWVTQARMDLSELLSDHTVMALVYLSDFLPVYADFSYDSSVIITVPSGHQVQIQDVFLDDDYEAWCHVTLFYEDIQYNGYIPRRYLACSDELFLEWEAYWNMNPSQMAVYALDGAADYPDIVQFPESYQEALLALKTAHPNWTFVKMNTGLDWNTVLANEMVTGRSLIPSSFPEYMKIGSYSSSWALASEATLAYYMDPRNWLTEEYIFMFELLTYNESYHTEDAVQAFLSNTFMSGTVPNDTMTYSKLFTDTGSSLGVSPFHLACRVYQEQGRGTSPLISGTYAGYEGYYNYFNVGASGSTDKAVIESGLAYAKEKGWTSPKLAIEGGAKVISANYILKGQDTLYLQKFDVDSSFNGLYWHQYMQNICAPSSEGYNIRKSYVQAGSLDNTFVFKIPVFNNMPQSCPKPVASMDVALEIPDGYTDPHIYLDGVAYDATIKNGMYVVTAPDGNCKTATMYKYNENGVPVGMYIWELSYNGIYTAVPVPELENLLSYHGFSIRITGDAGIRFKTGISASLRAGLLSDGIAGYTLKEYGTLVMTRTNSEIYPFIKDGTKVGSGRAYGQNDNGTTLDAIFETVDGRHRYTSVLVGLPAEQYKTEFSFRGYIILTKDGKDIIFYGPPVSKSIYELAEYLLQIGYYPSDSAADAFLRQLLEDADRLE